MLLSSSAWGRDFTQAGMSTTWLRPTAGTTWDDSYPKGKLLRTRAFREKLQAKQTAGSSALPAEGVFPGPPWISEAP